MPTENELNEEQGGNNQGHDDVGATPPEERTKEKTSDAGEAALSALRKERERVAELEKQLKERRRKDEERERAEAAERDKQLPEIERLKKSAEVAAREREEFANKAREAETELVNERKGAALERACSENTMFPKVRIRSAKMIRALANLSNLEYDSDSKEVLGIKEEIERVIKAYPDTVELPDSRGGSPGPPSKDRNAQNGTRDRDRDRDRDARPIPISLDVERHIGSYD